MAEGYKEPESCKDLKELFDSWRDKYKKTKQKGCFNEDYKGREEWFFPDGFLSNNNKCEILFISKESHEEEAPDNDDNTDFWMRRMVSGKYKEVIIDGKKVSDRGDKQIKYPRYLTAIYNKLNKDVEDDNYVEDKENQFKKLFNCGYMNLNKHGGGSSIGNHFKELVESDKEFIKKQIEIMSPAQIVLLGANLYRDFSKIGIFGDYDIYEVNHPSVGSYNIIFRKIYR